jgi:hypothetical protein
MLKRRVMHPRSFQLPEDVVRMLTDLRERLNMNRTEIVCALIRQEWTAQHRLRQGSPGIRRIS